MSAPDVAEEKDDVINPSSTSTYSNAQAAAVRDDSAAADSKGTNDNDSAAAGGDGEQKRYKHYMYCCVITFITEQSSFCTLDHAYSQMSIMLCMWCCRAHFVTALRKAHADKRHLNCK
jgi:hypothetical protein